MSEEEIFAQLFEAAKMSKDPDGVVAAALVRDGRILSAVGSADDGLIHAEQRLIEALNDDGLQPQKTDILYCTLEPCVKRSSKKSHLKDCCSQIIEAGISRVVYGVSDPNNEDLAKKKLKRAGIQAGQTDDQDISRQCLDIFNSTVVDSSKRKHV